MSDMSSCRRTCDGGGELEGGLIGGWIGWVDGGS